MSIRNKTLLVVGSTLICLLLTEFLVVRSLLLRSYSRLEERNARDHLAMALNTLGDDRANLDAVASDWSAWDDSYAFIEDQNSEYIRSNLVEDTFQGLKLNLVVFVHSSGRVVYQQAYDLVNEVEVPLSQELGKHLVQGSPLLVHSVPAAQASGILILPEGPMLLSARPILTSEETGPARGTLIMGRLLDAGQLQKWSERTFLDISLVHSGDPGFPAEFLEPGGSSQAEAPVLVRAPDGQSITGYSLLRDLYGAPVLAVKVDMPREIYSQGQESSLLYLGALLIFGLVMGVTSFWLLDRLVLKRVASLGQDIKQVESIRDHSGRVGVDGEDEIAQLALEINRMLQALQRAESALQLNEARYRSIVENQYDLVCQWLPDGKITFANEAYCRYFGSSREGIVGQSFLQPIDPQDREAVDRHIAALSQERGEGFIEYRVQAPDGSLRWQQWIDRLVPDPAQDSAGILSVGRDITEQKNTELELRQRVDFERLITQLSASFINISIEETGAQIDRTLQAIGEFAGVDRCYLFERTEDGLSLVTTHHWHAAGVEPQIAALPALPVSDCPWWIENLNQSEIIHVPSVADLPPEAAAEKTLLEAQGILSLIGVPLVYGGSLLGFVGFDLLRTTKTWPEECITILRLVGDILANAIAHQRFQRELQDREQSLRKLNEITITAIDSNDLGAMLDLLAGRMSELIDADGCFLTLWDEQSKVVTLASASQPYAQKYKDMIIEPGEPSLTAALLEAGHELIAEDIHASPYISPRISRLFAVHSMLGVPLIADNQRLGAVLLAFNQPHRFTQAEIDLCKQAARQVALAVLKMNLLQKSQQRAQEAETLRLSGAAIASTLDPEDAINRILDQLERVVPYDSASVQLLEDGHLVIRAGRGWTDADRIVGMRFPIPGDNPNTVVITQQKPYILEDARDIYGAFRSGPHDHIRSWLGVPLLVRSQIIGMLAVDKRQPHFYQPRHIDLVTTFADQVSISLDNARLYAEERRRARELDALQATVADITGELDMPSLLSSVVERAVALLGGTGGGLYLCDHARQELRCVTSINTPNDYTGVVLKFGEGAAGIVAQTRQPLVVGDYRVWEGRAQVYEKDQPFRSILSAPLFWREEVTGVIHILHNTETNRFKQDDLTLLTLFANQAAIALHNAQLYSDAQQRSRRIALLNEITQAAISAPDLDAMLRSLVERLSKLFEADGVSIDIWDEEHKMALPAEVHSPPGDSRPGPQFWNGEATMTSAVLDAGRVIVAEDVQRSQYIAPQAAARCPTRSMMGLPLIADGRKLGAVLIGYNRPRVFTQEDIAQGEEIGAQIALAMSKMRLVEIERHRADELDALRATVADISSELELETLLRKILERATTLLNASGGDLGLYEADQNQIRVVVSHNMGKDYAGTCMAWDEGAMGHAIATGLPVVIADYQQWEGRSAQYEDVPYHAVLAVPLQIRGRIIGALGIVDSHPKRVFSPGDQRLLHLFAQQAATAIENAQLFDETERQSITDMLTGLYNRRGVFEFGQRELDRSSRFDRPFSVILLDIDKFKQINDRYGHTLGDHILQGLAKRLQANLREIDILGRYGGEEFVVLLPETDEPGACLVAERGAITITISLGVSCQQEPRQELASLIDRADTAMYQAKRTGRNRTCTYESA